MEADLYIVAWELHNSGFSVIPSGGGESGKAPLVSWTEFQTRQPTDEEMHAWVDEYRPELWGIVTGSLADVFDCDTDMAAVPFQTAGLSPHVRTPRGGCHYYFKAPTENVKTVAGLLPGLDVRGDGGFVNVAGHNNAGEYQILQMPRPDNLYDWGQVPPAVLEAMRAPQKPSPKGEVSGIPQGQRNGTLASLAGTMRRRGMTEEAIAAALLATNAAQCVPPLLESEVRAIAASVVKYPPTNGNVNTHVIYVRDNPAPNTERDKNVTDSVTPAPALAENVTAWVKGTTGWWATEELDRDLGITAPSDKDNRRQALHRLKTQGVIEQHPKVNKQWRYVNKAVTSLDILAGPSAGVVPVNWPLGIEKYVKLFPGNIAVVAGAQNAGKTALLLNLVCLNMARFPIYYWCSEMGQDELRDRLSMFPDTDLTDWVGVQWKERAADFEDVIVPDAINVIDFLEMTDELYRVNTHLTAMSHKIGSGLAVVAIQKKEGAKFGRGQEFGLEKPKLYLSMDKGRLTIVKGKSWANPRVDPNGLTVGFKIAGGCQFEVTRPWEAQDW